MNNIDVIFYINLAHRTDRLEHITKQLRYLCPDMSKVIRIEAIKETPGAIGCTLSHIKALEQFEQNSSWTTCMIIEDDFTLRDTNITNLNNILSTFFTEFSNWDVISIGYNSHYRCNIKDTHISNIKKAIHIYSSSAYCIHKNFVSTLKQNFIESSNAKRNEPNNVEFCLDVYWKHIQPISNWYLISPSIGYQLPGYSDIENKFVDYKC